MRVAYDHQIFALQQYGGISRYFIELAIHLSSLKDIVDGVKIISPFYINEYLKAAAPALNYMGTRLPAIRRTGRLYNKINELLAPGFHREFMADILHETYYSQRSMATNKNKVVLTVYDMIHEIFPDQFLARDATGRSKKIAVQRADHIICISEHTRRDLIRLLDVDPARTSVVHLGFSLMAQPQFSTNGPPRPYLLYVGQRSGYKNFDKLLAAYAASPALHRSYDLVAFGGGVWTASERKSIGELSLDGRVKQIQGGDGALADLYANAAVFVYPSLYEGFGIPPLEAMSFGCPVACSQTSSIPEIVGDASIFFDPNSAESIVRAIETIVNDQVLARDLVARGRKRIQLFSWDRCAQETLAVYQGLVN